MYTNYVPFPYSPTTHLIPISHVPYPHHSLFIPVHAQLPQYAYTQVPNIMSSTLISHYPEIKHPANVHQPYVPPSSSNQGAPEDHDVQTQEYLNGFEHHVMPPTGIHPDEHADAQIDQENGNPTSVTRGGKLITDGNNVLPNLTPTISNQINESQKAELLPSTDNVLDGSPLTNQQQSGEPHHAISTTTESFEQSSSETLSGLVLQPSLQDIEHRPPDESSTIKLLSSPSVTKEPYLMPNSEDQETTTEIETVSTMDPDIGSSIVELNEPREADDTVTDILETPTGTEENTPKINQTTQTPESTTTMSTLLYSTTPLSSIPLCKNSDCSTTTSTHVTVPSIEITTKHQDTNASSLQVKSVHSTPQPARIDDDNKTTTTISSSTRPLPISTTISEVMTEYPHTTLIDFDNKILSTSWISNELTTQKLKSSRSSDMSDKNTPTSLKDTTLTSTLRPFSSNIITTTTELIKTTISPTPLITYSDQNNAKNVDQDISVSAHNESTVTQSTVTVNTPDRHQEVTGKTTENNLPSGLNIMSTKSFISRTPTTTEKLDVYTNVKTDLYPRTSAKETSNSLAPIATQTNPSTFVQKKSSISTALGDSTYRVSANNQDRYTSGTSSLIPQTLKGSDTWYSHLSTQPPRKNELNDEQIDYLLKKLIKLLRPEIEKQSITEYSFSRFLGSNHADQKKLVYVILPLISETNKNVRNEEQAESTTGPLKTSDKI